MKQELMTKASRLVSNIGFQLKKHSPEILLAAGITGTVVGTVLACKATTKVEKILNDKDNAMDDVHTCLENEKIDYTEQDAQRDTVIIYTQTGLRLLKLYGPAIGISVLSFGSIIASHTVLKKRNLALAAAYAAVDTGFKKYRKNVIEKFGKDIDEELRFGIKSKEIKKKDKDGNTIKEKVYSLDSENPLSNISEYAKFFDASCSGFTKDPEYNMMYLRRQQDYANERLKSKGHLFLNEVYDMLDIPRTKAGQIVGWVYNPKNPIGDNYVDFGLYNGGEADRRFVNGLEYNILLDFNVDGVIYDLL